MKIALPCEIVEGETRTALTPAVIPALVHAGHEVIFETGTGARAFIADDAYLHAGAHLAHDVASLYAGADMVVKVQPPQEHPRFHVSEAELVPEGATYIGMLAPFTRPDIAATFARRHVTAYALEFIPRLARAQSMDALSSMATVAGYKAVLLATEHLGKMLPLMMTAAGTIAPANVLVLGAGVAGLQAIATARRLGARVLAFDARPAVRDQVHSLGASFVEMALAEGAETAGGYAAEQSADFLARELATIGAQLPAMDVVITTAQVFGKRAPILLTAEMVGLLRPGAVVVDLAAEQGGNCALTRPEETVVAQGVTVLGPLNVPALLPMDASALYAHNVASLLRYLFPQGQQPPSTTDEIVAAACVTRGGEIVNEQVKQVIAVQQNVEVPA